jgi:hypothetical protein
MAKYCGSSIAVDNRSYESFSGHSAARAISAAIHSVARGAKSGHL